MGDVEEVDEGLYVAIFEEVGADMFSIVIFELLGLLDQILHLLFEALFIGEGMGVFVLPR